MEMSILVSLEIDRQPAGSLEWRLLDIGQLTGELVAVRTKNHPEIGRLIRAGFAQGNPLDIELMGGHLTRESVAPYWEGVVSVLEETKRLRRGFDFRAPDLELPEVERSADRVIF